MIKLSEKDSFFDLKFGDKLMRIHNGEVRYYTYISVHPIQKFYSKFYFIALHGDSVEKVSALRISVADTDLWFLVNDNDIDRNVVAEYLLNQLEIKSKAIRTTYVRKNKLS